MSRLAHALHLLPPGSMLWGPLTQANRDWNMLHDQAIREETLAAKQIQQATGCSWSEALHRVPDKHPILEP